MKLFSLFLAAFMLTAPLTLPSVQAATDRTNAAPELPTPPAESEVQAFIKANHARLFDAPDSPKLGPKNARLTLVSFTDYNCPYCKQFDPIIERVVKRHPDVALVVKLLPFRAKSSLTSAQLALTLWRYNPSQFWTLNKVLMAKKGYLDDESLARARAKAQVTLSAGDDISLASIADNLRLAEGVGVMGTPATIIGHTLVAGAISEEELEQAVVVTLAGKGL